MAAELEIFFGAHLKPEISGNHSPILSVLILLPHPLTWAIKKIRAISVSTYGPKNLRLCLYLHKAHTSIFPACKA